MYIQIECPIKCQIGRRMNCQNVCQRICHGGNHSKKVIKLVSFFQIHRPIIITTIPRHGTSNVQTQYQTRVFERLFELCVGLTKPEKTIGHSFKRFSAPP